MKLKDIHNVYFIGIGGIGMSALARWFHAQDVFVAGYDGIESELTLELVQEGIPIHYENQIKLIPNQFLDKIHTLIVYTPAIPSIHTELTHFKNNGFFVKKRSEVLGLLTENSFTIAVAGTHGKTTTSSIITHLLRESNTGCTAFVGGIMTNTGINLSIGKKNAPMVVEADEYDRSFMHLNPNYIIITSLDPDHLDIYGNETNMLDTYLEFMNKIENKEKIIIHTQAKNKIYSENKYRSYAIKDGDIVAEDLKIENGIFVFTYKNKSNKIPKISLTLPGYHNVENALAAITVALDMGMEENEIRARMKTYSGVKRRFEYIFKSPYVTLIDDYAHHPQEIEVLLKSIRALEKNRKITAIFQPHLYSRTNDFKKKFAEVLDKADKILLLDIYPAREKPILGVSSTSIYELMKNENKVMVSKEYLLNELDQHKLDVVLTIGAGDIDREVPKIAAYLKNRCNQKSQKDG